MTCLRYIKDWIVAGVPRSKWIMDRDEVREKPGARSRRALVRALNFILVSTEKLEARCFLYSSESLMLVKRIKSSVLENVLPHIFQISDNI